MTITEAQVPDTAKAARGSKSKPKKDEAGVAPVRTRRPPIWGFAAAALFILSVIVSVVIYTNASNATQVFVASGDIKRGSLIEQSDLTTLSIAAGQTTAAVPVSQVDELLGTIASVDIPAGGLVTKESTTNTLAVPDGKALVGLVLQPGRLPSQQLVAGDEVFLVPVPAQGSIGPIEVSQDKAIAATISQVTTIPSTNDVIVDVYVPAQVAPTVTAQAAAATLAIYLVPGGK